MANLLDPLDDDQHHLLRVIVEGWQEAGEQWPVWQYVMLRLSIDGTNAEDVFNSLPTWLYGYRPVFGTSGTLSLPSPEQQIGLTVHGMVVVDHPATNLLASAVVTVLATAEQWQRAVIPDPRCTVEIRHPLADLLASDLHATRPPTVEQLADLLGREPSTWNGLTSGGEGWHWDLSRVRLSPYRGVATVTEYLERLEVLVGIPEQLPIEVVVGPLSLVEELDHFALAWRLLTKDRILRIPRASLIGQLTQSVASQAEFKERCTALADIISNFHLPTGGLPKHQSGTLHRLEDQLNEHLGADSDDAREAAALLRRITRVRNGQQHSTAADGSDRDWVALGLARFGADWAGAWARIQVVAIQALRTIREATMRKVDGEDSLG